MEKIQQKREIFLVFLIIFIDITENKSPVFHTPLYGNQKNLLCESLWGE